MTEFTSKDILFMQRALELAALGRGQVSPNPMVGCIIVHNNNIIGEGWHKKFGEAHAEVNAVASVKHKELLKESTVYVTLEPCSHYGKTPPCADLLISYQVRKVIVALKDPNPLVAGKGIEKLNAEGIETAVGLLEKEARVLNVRFLTSFEKKRPYIVLKWAETKDGFIARSNYDSKWISNAASRKLVHKWRAEEDAILVGTNTARYDNPALSVRDWEGVDPVRIVIDTQLSLPNSLNLFSDGLPTRCYNLVENKTEGNIAYLKIDANNFIVGMLSDFLDQKIQSLIVEGGSKLLQSFIDRNLWDEARIFTGNVLFDDGINAPTISGELLLKEDVLGDELKIIRNGKS